MKYRLRSDGSIKTQGEIRKLNPNKILPRVWGEAVFEDLQIDPVLSTPKPEITELQVAYVSGTEQDSLGNWVESWTVDDKFKDIVDENGVVTKTAQEQIDEFNLEKINRTKLDLEVALDKYIEEVVKNKGYDNTDSIAKYLVSGNPFYDECTAISLWIGNVWVYAHTVESDVVAGIRSMPTIEELKTELPTLNL